VIWPAEAIWEAVSPLLPGFTVEVLPQIDSSNSELMRRARAGRTDPARLEDARLLFEQMLGYANHLGLYAEQTGNSGEALGNFPQAFTHLALISAAFNLDRALGGRS